MLAPALHFRIVSGRETNRGPVSRSHELLPSPQIRRIPTNRWNDVARCPRGSSVFSNDALASRERGGGHVWTRRKLIFDGVRGFDYRLKTNRLYQWNLITPYDYHNRGFQLPRIVFINVMELEMYLWMWSSSQVINFMITPLLYFR